MRAGQLLLFSGQQHSRNKYIYSYTPNREEQRNLTGKQFQTDSFSLSLLSLQTKQMLCTPNTQERTACPAKTTSPELELFYQPCFCSPVNVHFFFLSAAVSFLSAALPLLLCPSPSFSSGEEAGRKGGEREGGGVGGLENGGRESCLKCRPKRWWAFPWKQCSQQSVTSSVQGEATGYEGVVVVVVGGCNRNAS